MSQDFIPVNIPWITEEDADYVRQAVAEGWVSGEGKYVAEFEGSMASLCGRKHAIAVSNGSVAIDLVIEALGIGPGDEVILPSFAIISCMAQILRNGATPIFVDALPDTWNMDVSQVENLISPKTKAIMAVHIYGLPVDMDPLLEIASRRGIPVIEDAAESHGLKYKERVTGSMGLASTFSFYANKNITTGEGGMILTDDDSLDRRIRSLRNLAFEPERRFIHSELGWNSRLSSLQCALGTSQLTRVPEILERRKAIASLYNDAFSDLDGASLPVRDTVYAENNYWVYGIVLKPELGRTARQIMACLEAKGVGSRPFFFPLHRQPVLEKYGVKLEKGAKPESELLGEYGFYIPNGLGMSLDDAQRVAQAVLEVVLEQ